VKAGIPFRLIILALFAIGAAWALSHVDLGDLRRRVLGASPSHLGLMLAVWIVSLFLRPLRFRYLLRVLSQRAHVPYFQVWATNVLGMAVNSFTAMRAGDVVSALLLRNRLGIDIHRSLTVIAADALCDFVCVSLLFLSALSFAPVSAAWAGEARTAIAIAIVVVVASIAIAIPLRHRLLVLVDLLLRRFNVPWGERLREIIHDVAEAASAIAHWRVCLPLILFTGLIWVTIGLSYWFGMRAVAIEPSVASASFAMSAVALSFIVPLGPGGLGAFEAAVVVALSLFDVPLEAAIPFAIIAHAIQLGSALLLAMVVVSTQKIDYRSLITAAEKPGATSGS
jgi:hypothetical protein